MVCDTLFDWWTLFDFVRPYADKEEFKVDTCNIPFFISSFAGLIINIRMLTVYWHYIKFHWDCFFDGYSERCYKDHLRLNRLELWLSVVELVLKDDIQSVIVYLIYASHLTGSRPGWYFIVFSACSIFAHLKRCVCFIAKLCECGKGEGNAYEDSVIKCFACSTGTLASLVFLIFTVLSLPICHDGKSCVPYIADSCRLLFVIPYNMTIWTFVTCSGIAITCIWIWDLCYRYAVFLFMSKLHWVYIEQSC